MDEWRAKAVSTSKSQQQRRNCGDQNTNPSFSSTLLDAIYRSIDESDASNGKHTFVPITALKRSSSVHHHHHYKTSVPSVSDRAVTRPSRTLRPPSTSSSSDNSSYGGFSSSEPESAATHIGRILRPIRTSSVHPPRTQPPVPPPAPAYGHRQEEKKKSNSLRRKLRDLGKPRASAPPSPGARLAGFINSLFSAGSPRKSKPPSVVASESTCSSATSYSRSCLNNKTPAPSMSRCPAVAKRSVRFDPVNVILDNQCRAPPPPPLQPSVEDLLLGFGVCDDDWSDSSDSSSDLFELENFRAELPVYDSTRFDAVAKKVGWE